MSTSIKAKQTRTVTEMTKFLRNNHDKPTHTRNATVGLRAREHTRYNCVIVRNVTQRNAEKIIFPKQQHQHCQDWS